MHCPYVAEGPLCFKPNPRRPRFRFPRQSRTVPLLTFLALSGLFPFGQDPPWTQLFCKYLTFWWRCCHSTVRRYRRLDVRSEYPVGHGVQQAAARIGTPSARARVRGFPGGDRHPVHGHCRAPQRPRIVVIMLTAAQDGPTPEITILRPTCWRPPVGMRVVVQRLLGGPPSRPPRRW